MPLKEASESDVDIPQRQESANVVGLAPGQAQYRILIVEDQAENRLLLSKLMETVGFKVRVAENGKRGIELFSEWQPHLIWMDRRMPLMDGDQATRAIRKLPGGDKVKIVAVTASVFVEQREELFKSGMDDFVRKPYRFHEIYDCLVRQLGVKFVYEGSNQTEPPVFALMPDMLLELPAELRQRLKDALESLEKERIAAVIAEIASRDEKLGKTLSHLADNFDYPAILRAMVALGSAEAI